MTIVANDSITVSNVNDGTITHTAWSKSIDGADGFTTVYPNLNLSNNTQLNYNDLPTGISNGGGTDKSEKISITDLPGFSWGRKYTPSTRVAQSGMRVVTDVSKLKIGDTITNSFWVKNTGNRPIRFLPQLGFRYGTEAEPSEGISTGWNYTGGSDIEVKNDGKWTKMSITTIIPQPTVASNRTGDVLKSVVHYAYSSGAMMPLAATDTFIISPLKLELGSTATTWMPSASEVTTADWPSYIGQYTDFMQADSANPSDYTWSLMRGNDGVGIKTTDITYANSTSGTTAPSTGWTSSVPSLVKGQYLWTKTVWTYTDTSSKTGYSVTYNSKDGTNGTNGTSGIIVSSVAPASPQNGQLWQDTSTTPQLVKKWTGSSWVIWEFYAQNLKADTISTISLNLGDMNGGTVKLMDNINVNGTLKKYGIYQSKFGLLSSGPTLSTPSEMSNSQMGVANLNKGELRFIVNDYTEDLKNVQDAGMSDQNNAFIKFNSYDNGKDVMTIGSSGDIVFKGITSQDTPWIAS